ncbi:MAG: 2-oxoacid:acceptor oxidoreductase family protein [Blastocatellia bacterium]|nr:2-oxoacid:acceptor oxidoreductase family protein [Blastocatellia bacterium]MCS7156191.1 2-oxoacid:acceptor oxidoreductase family protein [Blastocatellia bacterium]MCX7751459.1 2-oxoacid:acceptor oxidoreductase family protein [Blastocatellia bacterium]MDW8169172.1 2-oxoacid:acceptor oxidoreductase family protein [Acidobacteriota bacterium]MDW8256033.1 2-oxoacid:acceptor oxidoreductase family protein [Acidobacteriota bacterium]
MYVRAYGKPKSIYGVFERKPGDPRTTHYCPGCGHGNVHKYIAEAIDDFGIQDRTILVSPVGCSVFAYYYFDVGNVQAAHGRAPAVATAIKRARPESIVISYQGDGDLAAIGGNEILHAANRGENITAFFINNAIYGMTGGQMAPTTLPGQVTTTTPMGRAPEREGFPLRVSELLASLEGPTYIERVALFDNKSRMRARKAIRKAIQVQLEGRGFSLVEILSPCPTGWGMTPAQACEWIQKEMLRYFPLGVFKDVSATRPPIGTSAARAPMPALAAASPEDILARLGLKGVEAAPSMHEVEIPARYRNPRVKVAGFGGQGVLFLGRLLAEAGMRQGYHVSWLPSYGPEMRGGTAHCHVTISTEPIASPLVSRPSVLIAMNRPSLERFEPEVIPSGLILYDSSLIPVRPRRADVETLPVPATQIADHLGSVKAANMVALGAYLGLTRVLPIEVVIAALEQMVESHPLVELNVKSLRAGLEYVSAR